MAFARQPSDLTQLLAGVILLLSFALLHQRRLAALIWLYAAQAGVLAAACAWQGAVQPAAALWLVAALTVGGKAIGIPAALRRLARRTAPAAGDEAPGRFPVLLIGVALVALCIALVLPDEPAAGGPGREFWAMALSVVLLGVLMMASRGSAAAQVIGLLSMENGLILAAAGVPGIPLLAGLALAGLVLAAAAAFGVLALCIDGRLPALAPPRPGRLLRSPQ